MKINWKYTVGEILIVIVGISLAFSLNNWKENRTNNKLKQQYLENLVIDLKEEIKQLEGNQVRINEKIQKINQVRPFLGNSRERPDSIAKIVFELAEIVNFYPENSTYQTLINSGDMKLIDNFQLRRSLEEHFALQKIVLLDYQRIEKIHERYLGDFFIHNIDYGKVYRGNTDFLENPLIGNIMSSIQGAYYLILNGNERCIESNKTLLEQVEQQL